MATEVCDKCGTTECLAELEVSLKVVRKVTPGDFSCESPTQYSQNLEAGDQISAIQGIILCNLDCRMFIERIIQAVRL